MAIVSREHLTDAERQQMAHEKDMFERQAAHTQKVKALEFEVAKIEAKWTHILRVPLVLVRAPLHLMLGVALIVYAAKKQPVPPELWQLLDRSK